MAPTTPYSQSGAGGNQSQLAMGSAHKRHGVDTGLSQGAGMSAEELALRQHFVQPQGGEDYTGTSQRALTNDRRAELTRAGVPYYYNQYDGLPVPYSAPSAAKEHFILKDAIRKNAGDDNLAKGVIRTDPITEDEVQYLKSMKDQAELAKFDEYVETLVDPRQPGNMKWLMEIYPDYVNRRLQQAHTDYEYAMRNQMIDSWGINTFDDLHFKYMVDQGKLSGPALKSDSPSVDASYTPGWLSPFNFQSPEKGAATLHLPFASAKHGRRPQNFGGDRNSWSISREGRPLGSGNTESQLAAGMYGKGPGGFDGESGLYTSTLGGNLMLA